MRDVYKAAILKILVLVAHHRWKQFIFVARRGWIKYYKKQAAITAAMNFHVC
jgi:hypothetical protein